MRVVNLVNNSNTVDVVETSIISSQKKSAKIFAIQVLNYFNSNVKNQRDIHSTDLQKVEAHFSGVVSRNFRALEKRKIGYMAIYIQYNIDSLSKKAVFGTNINLLK